jgi:phosphoserine phosphatase
MADSYLWPIDHDGTASIVDIGQRFLCGLAGHPDAASFVDEVARIRESPEYRDSMLRKAGCERHDVGVELGLMLASRKVSHQDVVDNARSNGNHLRPGFEEFLTYNPDGKLIVSAGDQTWLTEYYRKFGLGIPVIGTEADVGLDGRYCGIMRVCGRETKAGRVREYHSGERVIAVGDSSGDDGLVGLADETGGLSIGVGYGIGADVNVSAGDWHPVYLLGEAFKRLHGDGSRIPECAYAGKAALLDARANTALGRKVLNSAFSI